MINNNNDNKKHINFAIQSWIVMQQIPVFLMVLVKNLMAE